MNVLQTMVHLVAIITSIVILSLSAHNVSSQDNQETVHSAACINNSRFDEVSVGSYRAGDYVQVLMYSPSFDTVVSIQDAGSGIIENDDGEGVMLNSLVEYRQFNSESITIMPSSFGSDASGPYSLMWTRNLLSPELSVIGSLQNSSDEWWIYGRQNETIEISVSGNVTRLTIGGSTVSLNSAGQGSYRLDRDVDGDGLYQIEVQGTGSYSLSYAPTDTDRPTIGYGNIIRLDSDVSWSPNTYTFQGAEGDIIQIIMMSQTFDTVVELEIKETTIAVDDDSGGDRNSFLTTVLDEDGLYTIHPRQFSGEINSDDVYTLILLRCDES